MRNIQRLSMTVLTIAALAGCEASEMLDEADDGPAQGADGGNGDEQQDGGDGNEAAGLVGFYEVTAHTYRDGACDVPGDDVMDGPPLFEIYQETFGGSPMLFVHACDSDSDCEGSSEDFFTAAFLQSQGAGRYAGSAFLAVASTSCRLMELAAEAEQEGDLVSIEMTSRQLEDDLTASECNTETAQARADEMTCVELRTVSGLRLP